MRGTVTNSDPEVLYGPARIQLDQRARVVRSGQQRVALTRIGFELLRCLLLRRGETVTNDELAHTVWGLASTPDFGFIQTAVYRLRGALRDAGAEDVVHTVHGVGYSIPGAPTELGGSLSPPILEAALRHARLPLFIVDPGHRILLANNALAKLTGYSIAELESLPASVLSPGEALVARQDALERTLGGAAIDLAAAPIERRDRTLAFADIGLRPIAVNGRVVAASVECTPTEAPADA